MFTETINPLSSPRQIWSDIKTLAGDYKPSSIHCINIDNSLVSIPIEIANLFAQHWSKYSLDTNFPTPFVN